MLWTRPTSIRFPGELLQKIEAHCHRTKIKKSQFIISAVEKALNQDGETDTDKPDRTNKRLDALEKRLTALESRLDGITPGTKETALKIDSGEGNFDLVGDLFEETPSGQDSPESKGLIPAKEAMVIAISRGFKSKSLDTRAFTKKYNDLLKRKAPIADRYYLERIGRGEKGEGWLYYDAAPRMK